MSGFMVQYDNCVSVYIGMNVGYIQRRYDESGKRDYRLITGKIKSIKLGKRKQMIEVDGFYPLDLEDVCRDMRCFIDFLERGIMTVDTYFIADKKTVEHVTKWIEWAKTHDPSIFA